MPKSTARTRGLKKGDPNRPFSKDYQPSAESKKAGWERKRQAQIMMNLVLLHQSMTEKQFKKYIDDKKKKGELTIGEEIIAKYTRGALSSDKFLLDFINRHIPYAPQKTELTGDDGEPLALILSEIRSKRK